MNGRYLASLFTVIVVLLLLTVPITSQAQTTAEDGWAVPRTPWGDPDLQGVWSYASLTPLERSPELANQEFFTLEEAATQNIAVTIDSPLNPLLRLTTPGDVGNYNAAWFDPGKVSLDLRTSLIVDPPDGRLPLAVEMREQAAAQLEYQSVHPADSWLDRTNWDRCITYHGVPPISTGYNNTHQIFQAPGYVAIYVENIHDVRIIPVDGRPRLHDEIRQWNGDSRGRWEGDSLIVETTNYSDATQHRFPSSRNTRAVERFTRVSENLIDYNFSIEDPTVYSKLWTAVRPMPRLTDYVIYEYACHEGNYSMSNILAAERASETTAAGDSTLGAR